MNEIAIVGAGQLGSRHLQALARLGPGHRIWVTDPFEESLERCRQRYAEVATSASPPVEWRQRIVDLPKELAVVIVATAADVRRAVLESLLDAATVQHLVLEKVLFQRLLDYDPMVDLIGRRVRSAWVNCPRRMWSFYQGLRDRLQGATTIRLGVSGSDWGLGSNAVHFLDLFAFLCRSAGPLEIASLRVSSTASRRTGFIELVGELSGRSPAGHFSLASLPGGTAPVVVEVVSPDLRALVREGEGKAWISTAQEGWTFREEPVEIKFQSQLSDRFVTDLIGTGSCELTSLSESAGYHRTFIDVLTRQLGGDLCPIT